MLPGFRLNGTAGSYLQTTAHWKVLTGRIMKTHGRAYDSQLSVKLDCEALIRHSSHVLAVAPTCGAVPSCTHSGLRTSGPKASCFLPCFVQAKTGITYLLEKPEDDEGIN